MNPNPKSSAPTSHTETVALTTLIKNKSSQTLLDFLTQRFHYLNRSEWADRVRDGRVTVNEVQASEGQPLRAGDAVTYVTEPWEEPEVNKRYRVVYEDESLFLVSKPAPLPVHAVGAYFQNTLMTLLRKDIPDSKDYQLVHRLDAETSGLILLVKDRSLVSSFQKMWRETLPSPAASDGAVVGAGHAPPSVASSLPSLGDDKNRPGVHRGESPYGWSKGNMGDFPHERQRGDEGQGEGDFSSPSPLAGEGGVRGGGSVHKTYRAIVFGKFPENCKRVDAPIGPKVESSVRMKLAVVPHFEKGGPGGILVEGKPSITEFELLDHRVPHFEKGGAGGIYSDGFSLVEARILTGRTHQIRVHLEHLGYPIVGDKLYSGTDETFLHFYEKGWDEWLKEKVLLPRLALHACRLEFTHPVTGKKMVFEDPLPEDLMSFWNGL